MIIYDFSWETKDLRVFVPITIALLGFITYWFTASSSKIKLYFQKNKNSDQASINHILFCKYSGLFWMGVVPIIICLALIPSYSLSDYGLAYNPETMITSIYWIIGLSIPIIPLVSYSARQTKNLINYPQIRAKTWNRKLKLKNAIGWAAYLFGYELLFRGILLFPLVDEIGVWPAIAVNIALYSATHIPKGLDETIGAIFLGFVLCILTLQTNTIWIAFIVHVIMAWTNSFTALKYHPEMKEV